jgi:hypothetical protein
MLAYCVLLSLLDIFQLAEIFTDCNGLKTSRQITLVMYATTFTRTERKTVSRTAKQKVKAEKNNNLQFSSDEILEYFLTSIE